MNFVRKSVGLACLFSAVPLAGASAQSAPVRRESEPAKVVEGVEIRKRVAQPAQVVEGVPFTARPAQPAQVVEGRPLYQFTRPGAVNNLAGQSTYRVQLADDPHQGRLAETHAKLGVSCNTCHASVVNSALPLLMNRTDAAQDRLGALTAPADAALCSQLGLGGTRGLVVTKVAPKSLAAELGFHVSDLILKVRGVEMKEPADFEKALLGGKEEGASVELYREGKPRTIEVSADSVKKYGRHDFRGVQGIALARSSTYWIGVGLSDVDVTLRSHLKLAEGKGVLASNVVEKSPADKAGIKANDIVLEIDGKSIGTREGLTEAVRKSEGKPLKLGLLREGKPITIEVKPEPRPADQLAGALFAPADAARAVAPLSMMTRVRPGVVVEPNNPNNAAAGDVFIRRLMPQALPAPAADRDDLSKKLDRLSEQLDQLEKAVRELRSRGATPKR